MAEAIRVLRRVHRRARRRAPGSCAAGAGAGAADQQQVPATGGPGHKALDPTGTGVQDGAVRLPRRVLKVDGSSPILDRVRDRLAARTWLAPGQLESQIGERGPATLRARNTYPGCRLAGGGVLASRRCRTSRARERWPMPVRVIAARLGGCGSRGRCVCWQAARSRRARGIAPRLPTRSGCCARCAPVRGSRRCTRRSGM